MTDQYSYQGKEQVKSIYIKYGKSFNDGVVYYIILVHGQQADWIVRKRYSQIEALHINFIQLFLDDVEDLPQLPPKKLKLFQSHTAPQFIESRKVLIQNYLKKVLENKKLARSKLIHDFFNTDKYLDDSTTNNSTNSSTSQSLATTNNRPHIITQQSSSTITGGSDTRTLTQTQQSEISASSLISPRPPSTPIDSEVTSVSIPSTRILNDKVLYVIECSSVHKPVPLNTWSVMKRFAQFSAMDAAMRSTVYQHEVNPISRKRLIDALPVAPSKQSKFLTDHLDKNFVEERRVLMEHYLRKLLKEPECMKNPAVLEFLGCES